MKVTAESILILGDTHANFGDLNRLLCKHVYPDVCIITGDFGWWPHYHDQFGFISKKKKFDQYGIKNKHTKIFWCDGNHENHDSLTEMVKEKGHDPIEVMPNVFYCPRGSVVTINNENFLFFGGAASIDKHWRTPGQSWWPGENIQYSDLDALPDMKIDVVISHTKPKEIELLHNKKFFFKDSNEEALQIIFDQYYPNFWYFGHFHTFERNYYKGCRWTCLSHIQSEQRQYWYHLKKE